MTPPLKTFTREEVSRHASENDLWIIIDNAGEQPFAYLRKWVSLC